MKKIIVFILIMSLSVLHGFAQGHEHFLGEVRKGDVYEGSFDYLDSSGSCYFTFTLTSRVSSSLFVKMETDIQEAAREMYVIGIENEQGYYFEHPIESRIIDGCGITFDIDALDPGTYTLNIGMNEYCEWINFPAYHYLMSFLPPKDVGLMKPGEEQNFEGLAGVQEFVLHKVEGQTVNFIFTAPQPEFRISACSYNYVYEKRSEIAVPEVHIIDSLHSAITFPPDIYGDLQLTIFGIGTGDTMQIPYSCTVECLPESALDNTFYKAEDMTASIRTRTFHSASGKEYIDNIQYYDGLGFPVQQTLVKGSPDKNDIVTLREFDSRGKEYRSWLPVIAPAGGKCWTEESLKNNAKLYYADNYSYNLTQYEKSPRNNAERIYGPGYDWHTFKNNRFIAHSIMNNKTADHPCIRYNIDEEGMLKKSGYYPEGSLFVYKTTDEDGNDSYEFKNSQEQTILIRAIADEQQLDTYYVYDQMGNLRYVLPPMAAGTDDVSDESREMKQYAYLYRYDYRNRCIAQRLPGCDWTCYAYDKNDHLIFTQTGVQRLKGEWTFSFPDALGRTALEGICKDTLDVSQKYLIAAYDKEAANEGYNILVDSLLIDFPIETLHRVNYYDNYDFLSQAGFEEMAHDSLFSANLSLNQNSENQYKHAGLLTGSVIAVLTDTTLIRTASYYDNRQRVVRTQTKNHLGRIDREEFRYTFTDQIELSDILHGMPDGKDIYEVSYYTYDHAGRLEQQVHGINEKDNVAIARFSYDALGRMKTMTQNEREEYIDYSYNIRNQLTGIYNDKFSQTLHYTDGAGSPIFNGNISSMTWKTDSIIRGYQYKYDGVNRLREAIYGEGDRQTLNINRYNERVTRYDKQGNILETQRYGKNMDTGFGLIDNLTLKYQGNQLQTVTDSVAKTAYENSFEFKDNANLPIEYSYDADGNLTQDLNKKIVDIQYNSLNLPSRIQFEDGNSISYLYDANGSKLRTTHVMDGDTLTTDYCSNAIYENGVLDKLMTEQGYITLSDTTYHYFMQDHQGNNRVVVNQNGTIEEVNHYYPFGGIFASTSSAQPYKYNGKELDRKGGLDWYDYGARMYDAALGRWHVVDELSEHYNSLSPYSYCINNPVNLIDPDGNEPETTVDLPEITIIGQKVAEPISGFWNTIGYYLLGRTITLPIYGINDNGISEKPIAHITYNVNKEGIATRIAPIGGIAPTPSFTGLKIKEILQLLKAGRTMTKGGLTAVGRALKKHGDRSGSAFPKAIGNPTAINQQGETLLKKILEHPNVQRVVNDATQTLKVNRYGANSVDYKIPGGIGARFSSDGNFITFLEP